jgi:hypothetical protein
MDAIELRPKVLTKAASEAAMGIRRRQAKLRRAHTSYREKVLGLDQSFSATVSASLALTLCLPFPNLTYLLGASPSPSLCVSWTALHV